MGLSISGLGAYDSYEANKLPDWQRELRMTPYEKDMEASKKADAGIKTGGEKKEKGDPGYECETCKNRKYQDGSNEMVSFKSAQHVSPNAAASAVRAHEQEHVSNAYKKAATDNGKVIQASVTIKTAVCPECGRSYVAGGETNTQIKYYNEDNPYQQDLKTQDASKYGGKNVDAMV